MPDPTESDLGGAAHDSSNVLWKPTALADNIIVCFSAAHQLVILITVLHLVYTSKWPPYIVRNVTLLSATGIAGALWAVVIISSFGTYRRTSDSLWAHCDIEILLLWVSVGMLSNAGFLRVYRHWKLLYVKDRRMWSTEWQLGMLMVPFVGPSVFYFFRPDLISFDPTIQECHSEYATVTPIMGTYCIGQLFSSILLLYNMRHLRKQFNEYKLIKRVTVLIIMAPTLFVVIDAATGPEHGALRRRMEIALSIFITGMMFWSPCAQPVWAFIVKDEEYLDVYTQGFFELPTPAQLRASLADKMTVEELREEFQRYARTRVARQFLHFYNDVLERDTVDDYFERQAVTMGIIDKYVRRNSPHEVKLTDGCRDRLLTSDVTKFDIFEEARLEVLKIMEDTLQRDFEHTAAYQRFRSAVETQARERLLLIGSGILPEHGTPPCSPGRVRSMIPPVYVPTTPDRAESLCYSSDGYVMYSGSSADTPIAFPLSMYNTCSKASPDQVQIV